MRFVIRGHNVIALALLIAACADPSGPEPPGAEHPTLARQRPTVPVSVPDSVGIPPSIPPIFEEAPAGFDAAQ